jgi:hypothetical protein
MNGVLTVAAGIAAVVASCTPGNGCTPPLPTEREPVAAPAPDPAPAPAPVPADTGYGEIRFPGRNPVAVVGISTFDGAAAAQAAIDRGALVDITGDVDPWDGYAHVAGHYSSAGGPMRPAANLNGGDVVSYSGRTFVVAGRGASAAGAVIDFREGLTLQYSGCGGVCLVYLNPAEG